MDGDIQFLVREVVLKPRIEIKLSYKPVDMLAVDDLLGALTDFSVRVGRTSIHIRPRYHNICALHKGSEFMNLPKHLHDVNIEAGLYKCLDGWCGEEFNTFKSYQAHMDGKKRNSTLPRLVCISGGQLPRRQLFGKRNI